MKKMLLILSVVGIFTACGTPKVKLTTQEYKNEIVNKMVLKNDAESIKKYEEITSKLKVAMEKGSLEAKKEYEEWSNLYEFKRWMKS